MKNLFNYIFVLHAVSMHITSCQRFIGVLQVEGNLLGQKSYIMPNSCLQAYNQPSSVVLFQHTGLSGSHTYENSLKQSQLMGFIVYVRKSKYYFEQNKKINTLQHLASLILLVQWPANQNHTAPCKYQMNNRINGTLTRLLALAPPSKILAVK